VARLRAAQADRAIPGLRRAPRLRSGRAMSEPRKTLSIRSAHAPGTTDVDPAWLIGQAIERRLCLRWTYNRTAMLVAPQILFRKHEELFADAVVLERNGAAPAELKLGSFKLAGLSGLSLSGVAFDPSPLLERDNPRYAEGIEKIVS
jgi:hypothetical protein